MWRAPNPPSGGVIDYFLKSDKDNVSITIADASGTVLRTLRNVPVKAGVNRTEWDLR